MTDPAVCHWRGDEDGNWDTDCGECFCVEEGTPQENTYNFCPSCGKKLVEIAYRDPEKTS